MPVGNEPRESREYLCQQADQHSQSARRNKHGNRDNGTKQSAGISENRRRPLQAARTRWPSCASTLQSRQRSSISAQLTVTAQRSPLPVTKSPSNGVGEFAKLLDPIDDTKRQF